MECKQISDKIEIKQKAKIFQLIPWEKRKNYFSWTKWPTDGEYDLLHVVDPDFKTRNHLGGLHGYIIWNISGLLHKFPFRQFDFDSYVWIWVKRPHNFKLHDIIDMSVSYNKSD